MHKFKKILSVFDGVVSIARMPCGKVCNEHIVKLENFIATAMTLWRGLGNSITPKVHAIEDRLVEQVRKLKGISDLSEDLIEKSHQDGIIDHSRTKNSLTHEDKAKQHSCREHKWLLPSVKCHAEHIAEASKRYKAVNHENDTSLKFLVSKTEQQESKVREDKKKVREDELLIASEIKAPILNLVRKFLYKRWKER
jgi:hypothetical protein